MQPRTGVSLLAFLVLALGTAVGVAGCGGDDDGDGDGAAGGSGARAPEWVGPWQDRVKEALAEAVALSEDPPKGPQHTQYEPLADAPCRDITPKTEGDLTVGFSYASKSNSAVVQIVETAERYLDYSDDVGDLITADAQDNPSKQISDIQSMVGRGVDLLLVQPTTVAASPAVGQACEAGIPVITFDRGVEPDTLLTATVTADQRLVGYNLGTAVADALEPEGGNVVMLPGLPGIGTEEEILKGGKIAFDESSSRIEVLGEAFTDFDIGKGRRVMENFLTTHDDIDAVFADSGLQSVGALEALQGTDRLNEMKMVTGGIYNGYLKLWDDLGFPGYASTNALDNGVISAQLGIDIVRGDQEPPPRNVPAPIISIDQESLGEFVQPNFPDGYWATNISPPELLSRIFEVHEDLYQ